MEPKPNLYNCSVCKLHLLTACHHSACLAEDCFELGRLSYNNEDHYHTIMWMEEALIKTKQEDDQHDNTAAILDYLAFSSYMVMLHSAT